MLRGYRLLGVAALAAALLIAFGLGAYWVGLPHPQERYQSYQDGNANEGGALDTVSNVPTAIVERTPCYNPKSESESDLCAQWRAAKAAEKSADWTLYGVIASAIGISLLLWQIMLTREAVEDTGKATLAMERQNEIVLAGQRPWLKFTSFKPLYLTHFATVPDGSRYFEFVAEIAVENIGQTPAASVFATGVIWLIDFDKNHSETLEKALAIAIDADKQAARSAIRNQTTIFSRESEVFNIWQVANSGETLFGNPVEPIIINANIAAIHGFAAVFYSFGDKRENISLSFAIEPVPDGFWTEQGRLNFEGDAINVRLVGHTQGVGHHNRGEL